MTIATGLLAAGITPIRQLFFDSAGAAAYDGDIQRAVIFGIVMAVSLIITLFLRGFEDVMAYDLFLRLQSRLTLNFRQKAAQMPAIQFEHSEFLDEINKAAKGTENGAKVFFALTSIGFFTLPYFIFMSIYLINLAPLLILCVLFSFLPSVVGQIIRFKQHSKLEHEIAPLRRKTVYYERCINDREHARETRLLGAFWFFRTLHETYLTLTAAKSWGVALKTELVDLGIRFAMLAGYVGTIYLMYLYLMDGRISVGAFAAVFSSLDMMFDFMEGAINYNVSEITSGMGTVRNYMKFLSIETPAGQDVDIASGAVRFEHVAFTYPNAEKPALININLEIQEGETIAIVGENGAGKSTLAKLLVGLYTPSKGDILRNGHSTQNISTASIFKNTSAVFQRYQRYRLTLSENVAIALPNNETDVSRISNVLTQTEIDPQGRSFPNGMDTMLSREFDGVDLSGGQWQRIAIARGLYRHHNLIVLDEPTAAIDPIEETRIYKLFAELSKDKTAIIITHRLGSAKIADRIVVLDNGQIADIGTHETLMSKDGIYKDMYTAQAQWYDSPS